MGVQSFILISSVLSSYAVGGATGASIYSDTLCKNCYKMQMCTSIASIFGINEECIKVNSCTKFTVNLMNIKGVISIYSRKKDQTSVMATGYGNNLKIGVYIG